MYIYTYMSNISDLPPELGIYSTYHNSDCSVEIYKLKNLRKVKIREWWPGAGCWEIDDKYIQMINIFK